MGWNINVLSYSNCLAAASVCLPKNTHLLRTIFANSDVECILRAKTLH